MAPDYEQAGLPFDPPGMRVSRLIEAVTIMKGLFDDGPVDFEGQHYRISGHEGLPKPVQRPRPPLLIAGGGERMLRFAAREADIIGLNPRRVSNDDWANQNVADATAEATDRKLGWIRESAGERFTDIELSIVAPFVATTDDRAGFAAAVASGLDTGDQPFGVDDVLASPHLLVGTLEEQVTTLEERRERWGLSYYVFNDASLDDVAPLVARLAGR